MAPLPSTPGGYLCVFLSELGRLSLQVVGIYDSDKSPKHIWMKCEIHTFVSLIIDSFKYTNGGSVWIEWIFWKGFERLEEKRTCEWSGA